MLPYLSRGCTTNVAGCTRGLFIQPPPTHNASNVLVEGCLFQDIRAPFMDYAPASPAWARAILVQGPDPDHCLRHNCATGNFMNLTIRNNIAARVDVFFWSVATFADGLTLDSNTVQQCSGNCYNLGRGANMLLQNSVMLRDTPERLFLFGTTDVIVAGLSGHNSLLDNDFVSNFCFRALF